MRTILKLKNFHHQIIANLQWNVTEIERFLKHAQNLVSFEKSWFFFEKLDFFFKFGKDGKFAAECVSNDIS